MQRGAQCDHFFKRKDERELASQLSALLGGSFPEILQQYWPIQLRDTETEDPDGSVAADLGRGWLAGQINAVSAHPDYGIRFTACPSPSNLRLWEVRERVYLRAYVN